MEKNIKKNFETYLRHKAIALVHENWNIKECADQFGIDYKNMCAYVACRKPMPLKYVFSILDYLGCNIVVFRRK